MVEPLINAVAAVMLAVAAGVVPGRNTVTPASAEGDGMVPGGTASGRKEMAISSDTWHGRRPTNTAEVSEVATLC